MAPKLGRTRRKGRMSWQLVSFLILAAVVCDADVCYER